MQNIRLAITSDEVQRTGNADSFFIKVNGKHIVAHEVCFFRNTLCGSKAFTLR